MRGENCKGPINLGHEVQAYQGGHRGVCKLIGGGVRYTHTCATATGAAAALAALIEADLKQLSSRSGFSKQQLEDIQLAVSRLKEHA